MSDELDTLIDNFATALADVDGIVRVWKELPKRLSSPPEAWVKMGDGVSQPFAFGEQEEIHIIEVWLWVGTTDAAHSEELLRKLYHKVMRKILEDETFSGACEGVHNQISYITGWQLVGGIQYRKMEMRVPCTLTVLHIPEA